MAKLEDAYGNSDQIHGGNTLPSPNNKPGPQCDVNLQSGLCVYMKNSKCGATEVHLDSLRKLRVCRFESGQGLYPSGWSATMRRRPESSPTGCDGAESVTLVFVP